MCVLSQLFGNFRAAKLVQQTGSKLSFWTLLPAPAVIQAVKQFTKADGLRLLSLSLPSFLALVDCQY